MNQTSDAALLPKPCWVIALRRNRRSLNQHWRKRQCHPTHWKTALRGSVAGFNKHWRKTPVPPDAWFVGSADQRSPLRTGKYLRVFFIASNLGSRLVSALPPADEGACGDREESPEEAGSGFGDGCGRATCLDVKPNEIDPIG
jgi:hypothetical protein